MGKVSIYSVKEQNSLQILRQDVISHIQDFFPDFRSFPQTSSLYNDEHEEIIFIAQDNVLVYVKLVDGAGDTTLDYILDDYVQAQQRWKRFCKKHDTHGTGRAGLQCRLVLVSHRFSDSFFRKAGFLSEKEVCLREIRMITSPTGTYSYVCEDVAGSAKKEPEIKTRATAVDTEVSEVIQNPKSQVSVGQTEQQVEEPVLQSVGSAPSASVQRKQYPDFFERAQLTTEEERAFFLLNKQLADHID